MRFLLFIALTAAACLAWLPRQAMAAPPSLSAYLAEAPLAGFLDEYDPEARGEAWGKGGALADNLRLSFHAHGVFPLTTRITDADHADHWSQLWEPGLGGNLGLGYQLMPILRGGVEAGYLGFHGGKEKRGNQSTDYEDMHFVPLQVSGTLCLPVEESIDVWFTPGKGFVPGPVLYVQVDFGWAWRTEVEADVETSGTAGGGDLQVFRESFRSFFGVRFGLEFRKERLGFFIDVGYRVYERPEEGRDLVGEALEMHTAPVHLGFAFYFGG